jgi:hypothetical protein
LVSRFSARFADTRKAGLLLKESHALAKSEMKLAEIPNLILSGGGQISSSAYHA